MEVAANDRMTLTFTLILSAGIAHAGPCNGSSITTCATVRPQTGRHKSMRDKKIARFRELVGSVQNPQTVKSIDFLIAELEARKVATPGIKSEVPNRAPAQSEPWQVETCVARLAEVKTGSGIQNNWPPLQ